MKITTWGNMPSVSFRKPDKLTGKILLENGTFVDIFKELSKLLNFSYSVTVPHDKTWGRIKDDGTWSGMVGQLESKVVDFGTFIFAYIMSR